MLITVDTNVLYMGLYSSKGASFQILKSIRAGDVQLALSIPVFKEYEDVLTRPKTLSELGFELSDMISFLDGLAALAFPFDIHFMMRPNLRDENDNMFVDLAFASSSEYLITSNLRDFQVQTDLRVDNFELITPSQFIKFWRSQND